MATACGGAGVGIAVGATLGCGAGAGGVYNCWAGTGAAGVTLGDWGGDDTRLKMSLRALMAANWASPGVLNGELGWGLAMASASCLAACVASMAGEDVGTAQRWGKNSTVKLTRSPRVDGR